MVGSIFKVGEKYSNPILVYRQLKDNSTQPTSERLHYKQNFTERGWGQYVVIFTKILDY